MFQQKSAVTLFSMVALAVGVVACGSSGSQKSPGDEGNGDLPAPQPISLVPADPSKRAVMVVDDGLDLNDDVFKNKILATYSIECSGKSGGEYSGSFEQIKRALLQELSTQDTRCRIQKNINFRPSNKFSGIGSYRNNWNRALLGKDFSLLSPIPYNTRKTIAEAVTGEDGKYNYHGTATAGTVSYNNDNVQLVLVQKQLSMGYQSQAANEPAFACITKTEVERELQIYKDADVQKAYIERPLSTEEEGIQNLIREHNISLLNLSLGRLTRGKYEELAKAHDCMQFDLREYFQTVSDLDRKRTAYQWQKGSLDKNHLIIQAAGNDSQEINTGADAFDCSDVAHNRILVGATDARGKATDFTNFGNCVDVFTMGDEMVVSAPQNFLSIAQGTSFSAPMLTRHVSKTVALGATPQEIIAALKNQVDANKFLPATVWPVELAWELKNNTIVAYNFAQGLQDAALGFLTGTTTSTLDAAKPSMVRSATISYELPRLW